MVQKVTYVAIHMALIQAIIILASIVNAHEKPPILLSNANAHDTTPIPSNAVEVDGWFKAIVKPLAERKAMIEPQLAAAEAIHKVIKVRKDGSGDFKTITDAVNSIPVNNKNRVIVWIGGGEYTEKIKIGKDKPFITFYGSANAIPRIVYNGTAAKYGTVDSATLIVESDFFMAANVEIANSAPKADGLIKGAQAVAMRISGDMAAFYGCKFRGFQDTLCDDKNRHFFKDCFIEGAVDYIFGSGKSLYLNSELHCLAQKGMSFITAQARQKLHEDTGYSFVHCNVTGRGKGTYLGRAWMSHPRVIFAFSNMGKVVNAAGWTLSNKLHFKGSVFFGEYKSFGPMANLKERAEFVKQLTDNEVKPFISLSFVGGLKWLLPPPQL